MRRFPSRRASSRQVANKHFIEIMVPQSSISVKKVKCLFESLDGTTSDLAPKKLTKPFSTSKADPKAFKALVNDLCKFR